MEESDATWMYDRWEDSDYWQNLADYFQDEHDIFVANIETEVDGVDAQ